MLSILLSLSSLGYLYPTLFLSFKEHVPYLLTLVMLSMGMTLSKKDFINTLKKPLSVTYGAILHYTIMPILGFLIPKLFDFGKDLSVGMVLVGSAPSGTASTLITYLSKGDLAYSVSVTTFSTLLSPLLTPFWAWLLAGRYVSVPFLPMVTTTLKLIVLPIIAGMFLKRFIKVQKVERFLPYLTTLCIALIIAVVLSLNRDALQKSSSLLILGVSLHIVLGFVLGYAFGRLTGLDVKLSKTLSIEVGMQNSALSTVLALNFFGQEASLPSAIFSLLQNLYGLFLSFLLRRL